MIHVNSNAVIARIVAEIGRWTNISNPSREISKDRRRLFSSTGPRIRPMITGASGKPPRRIR